jgi:multifunctional methyltransferase subunit TRM112
MKLLTMNFLTCARKTCKSAAAAFPLHPKEAELEQVETDMNATLIKNILPRLDWDAMKTLTTEVRFIPTSFFIRSCPLTSL